MTNPTTIPDTPTPGEAAALPVVARAYTMEALPNGPTRTHIQCLRKMAGGADLVRLSDAQAIIHRLTNELDVARAKLQGFALQALSDERQADELVAHQAAALPTIEAIMDLADRFADMAADYQEAAPESR